MLPRASAEACAHDQPTIGAGRESTNLRVSVAPHVPESDSQPIRRALRTASGEPADHKSSSGVTRSPCEYGLHLAAGFGQYVALDTPAAGSICVLSAGDDSVTQRALPRNVSSGIAAADEAPRCSASSRECPSRSRVDDESMLSTVTRVASGVGSEVNGATLPRFDVGGR